MDKTLILETVLDYTDNIICITDIETHNILYLNKAGRKLCGFQHREDYLGRKCYEVFQGSDKACKFCTNNLIKENETYKWVHHNKKYDLYFKITDKYIELYPDYFVRIQYAVDITDSEKERLQLDKRLLANETLLDCIRTLSDLDNQKFAIERLLAILAHYYKGHRSYIFEIDYDHQLTNNTYEWCDDNITQEKDNLQNIPINLIDNWIYKFKKEGLFYISSLNKDIVPNSVEYNILANQGIESLMAAPLIENGVITGFIGVDDPQDNINDFLLLSSVTYFVINDIQKRKLLSQFEYLSFTDVLTGVHNRNHYLERLNHIQQLDSYPDIGIAYLDLDQLKQSNDHYGHEYGDLLIKELAKILKSIFDKNVYRVGGDEFVVICQDIQEQEFNLKIQELKDRFMDNAQVMASLGYVWQAQCDNIEILINKADQKMYINKEKHKKVV